MKPGFILRSAILSLLMSTLMTLSPVTHAAGASSIPSYSEPILRIPRIDVPGYGSLDVSLSLENATTLTFSIGAAIGASQQITPGATFNSQTGLLDIPLARVGTDYYNVKMNLMPGDKFQISVANPANLVGLSSYNTQCASCHGADGMGTPSGTSLINCATCGNFNVLSSRISSTMPLGNPGTCVGSCATNLATFIQTVFKQ